MYRLLADKHIYRSMLVSGKIWTKDTRVPASRPFNSCDVKTIIGKL